MEDEIYIYKGEEFTRKELEGQYGDRLDEAIDTFGIKKKDLTQSPASLAMQEGFPQAVGMDSEDIDDEEFTRNRAATEVISEIENVYKLGEQYSEFVKKHGVQTEESAKSFPTLQERLFALETIQYGDDKKLYTNSQLRANADKINKLYKTVSDSEEELVNINQQDKTISFDAERYRNALTRTQAFSNQIKKIEREEQEFIEGLPDFVVDDLVAASTSAGRAVVNLFDFASILYDAENVSDRQIKNQFKTIGAKKGLGLSQEQIDKGIAGSIEDGDISAAFTNLVVDGAAQVPQLGAALAVGLATKNPSLGIKVYSGLAGANAGAAKYAELISDPTMSETAKVLSSVAVGVTEAVASRVFTGGTQSLIRRLGAAGVRKNMPKGILSQARAYGLPLTKGIADEALEEGFAQGFESFIVDHVIRGEEFNPYAVADAMIIGATMGGSVTSATLLPSYRGSYKTAKRRAEIGRDIKRINNTIRSGNLSDAEQEAANNKIFNLKKEANNLRKEDALRYKDMSREDTEEVIRLNRRISLNRDRAIESRTEEGKNLILGEIKSDLDKKKAIEQKYDSKTEEQVPSTEQEREAAVEAQPDTEAGEAAVETGRVVQLDEETQGELDDVMRDADFTVSEQEAPTRTSKTDAYADEGVQGGIINLIKTKGGEMGREFAGAIDRIKSTLGEGYKVVVLDDARYRDVTNTAGRGAFDTKNKVLYLNAQQVRNLDKDNVRAVYHEAIHPILTKRFGEASADFVTFKQDLVNAINRSLSGQDAATLIARLEAFEKQYAKDKTTEQQAEEFMTELGAIMASEDVELLRKSGLLNRIKELINNLLRKLGSDISLDTENDVVEFMNSLAQGVRGGVAVADIVKKENAGYVVPSEEALQESRGTVAINPDDVRSLNRAGSKVGMGLKTKTVKKVLFVIGESEEMSIAYAREVNPKFYLKTANQLAQYPLVSGVKKLRKVGMDGKKPMYINYNDESKRKNELKKADEIYSVFKEQVKGNLRFLMDNASNDFKELMTLWYDGANKIASDFSSRFGYTPEQAAGVIASLSPQKDWYQNVRLAELVMEAMTENPTLTDAMVDKMVSIRDQGYKAAKRKGEKEAEEHLANTERIISYLRGVVGTSLNNIPNEWKPYLIRLDAEINKSKNYDILLPDGNSVSLATTKSGRPAKWGFGSFAEIGKAVSILIDGSQNNISAQLGKAHKIRNFYNNIIDPMSEDGDVTMDTHAVAASLLLPVSGSSKEVTENLSGIKSDRDGLAGNYFAHADAYRELAEEMGYLPRQIQSITWEVVRGLYTKGFKGNKQNVNDVREIFDNFAKGKITIDEARNQAAEKAGGFSDPTWGEFVSEESRNRSRQESERRRSDELRRDAVRRGERGGLEETPLSESRRFEVDINPIEYSEPSFEEGAGRVFTVDGGSLEIAKGKESGAFMIMSLNVEEGKRRQGRAEALLSEALEYTEGKLTGMASNDSAVRLNYKLGMRSYYDPNLSLEETMKQRAKNAGGYMLMALPSYIQTVPKKQKTEKKEPTPRFSVGSLKSLIEKTSKTIEFGERMKQQHESGEVPMDEQGLTELNKILLEEKSKLDGYVKELEEHPLVESRRDEDTFLQESRAIINEQFLSEEKQVAKFRKAGVDNKQTQQAINDIGLKGVKFTKEGIEEAIQKAFDDLAARAESFVMTEDSKAITGAIMADIEAMRADGASESEVAYAERGLEEGSPVRGEYMRKFQDAQRNEIRNWVSYLNQSDYNTSFKYLILDGVLTNNYDKKRNKYVKRDRKTLRSVTPFNAASLAELYQSDSKEMLKDYTDIQEKNAIALAKSRQVATTTEGEWIKYDGGDGVSNEDIANNASELAGLVSDTPWCTKTNAASQLRAGDFYVYATKGEDGSMIPRIAIRMEGDQVGEVRGVASEKQDLEPSMNPVAEKFLKENIPNDSGQGWLDSIEYNEKAEQLLQDINEKGLNRARMVSYFELLPDEEKYTQDYGRNGHIERLEAKIEELVENNELADDLKGKVIMPSIQQYSSRRIANRENLGNAEFVIGELELKPSDEDRRLRRLTGDSEFKVQYVSEDVTVAGDVTNIKFVGGDLRFFAGGSPISVEEVGEDVYAREATTLGNLRKVGGDLTVNYDVKDLGNLEEVGGELDISDSNIRSLGNKIKSVGYLKVRGKDTSEAALRTDDAPLEDFGSLEKVEYIDLGADNLTKTIQPTENNIRFIENNRRAFDEAIDSIGRTVGIGRTGDPEYDSYYQRYLETAELDIDEDIRSEGADKATPSDFYIQYLKDKAGEAPLVESRREEANKALEKRLKGDSLLEAKDTLDELLDNNAEINSDGTVVVYHRSTEENIRKIVSSNEMFGLEDGVFFSTLRNGQAESYGDYVVKMSLPIEMIEIDDVFGDEAHVRIPTKKPNQKISIKKFNPVIEQEAPLQESRNLAPNGQPSNLNDEQYKIVRTPEFKRWFGDWENDPENASKVVDENGEPLVVYHGSPAIDIESFDRSKSKKVSSGLKMFGTYFSTNPELAEIYASAPQTEEYKKEIKSKIESLQSDLKKAPSGERYDAIDEEIDRLEELLYFKVGRVYPVFLSMKDMVTFDAKGKQFNEGAWRQIEADAGYKIAKGIDAIELYAGYNTMVGDKQLKDGVKAENIIEGDIVTIDEDGKRIDESLIESEKQRLIGDAFLVFDHVKNYAKLADGSNRTFDPEKEGLKESRNFDRKTEKAMEGVFYQPKIDERFNKASKRQMANKKLFDRQGIIRRALQDANDLITQAALSVRNGSSAAAKKMYERFNKNIFLNVAGKKKLGLNEIIMLRRIISIYDGFDRGIDTFQQEIKDLEAKKKRTKKETARLNAVKKQLADLEAKKANFKNPRKLNRESALARLDEIKQKMRDETGNDQQFFDMDNRASRFFDAMREILKRKLDEGLITQDEYFRLSKYEYSPRMFVDKVFDLQNGDFAKHEKRFMGYGLSEKEFNKLKDGSEEDLFMEGDFLLRMVVAASESRVFANRLFKQLGKKVGSYEWLSDTKKNGFSELTYKEDGKSRSIYVRNDIAEEIENADSAIEAGLGKVGKYFGTNILRAMATGYNPLFPLSNIPMDFTNVVMFTDTYDDMSLGRAMIELSKDFRKNLAGIGTITAALRGTTKADPKVLKNLEEAFEAGIGMDFLTNQGRVKFKTVEGSKLERIGQTFGDFMSSFGENSELAMRLSVYNKVKADSLKKRKEGKDAQFKDMSDAEIRAYAAFKARATIDFSQGGSLAKSLDKMSPYFNASLQGLRVAGNYIRTNPAKFGKKFGESALYAIAMSVVAQLFFKMFGWDDDDKEAIPEYHRRNYFIIPLGDIDDDGNKEYVKIRKLPQLAPLLGLYSLVGETTYRALAGESEKNNKEFYTKGLVNFENTLKAATVFGDMVLEFDEEGKPSIDVGGVIQYSPPVAKAIGQYITNYDFFRERNISYEKLYNQASPEFEGKFDDNVEEFYKEFGELTGMSPKRTKNAIEVVTTSPSTNLLVGVGYGIANAIIAGDKSFKDVTKGMKKRSIGTANKKYIPKKPSAELNNMLQEYKDNQFVVRKELTKMVVEDNAPKKDVIQYVNGIEDRKLREYAIKKYKKLQRKNKFDDLILDRKSVYYNLDDYMSEKPELAAEYLFNEFGNLTNEELREVASYISMIRGTRSFSYPPAFMRKYRELQK